MSDEKDKVVLDIHTYDQLKNQAVKASLVIDRLFEFAELNKAGTELVFNKNNELNSLLQLAFWSRYNNKFDALREARQKALEEEAQT